MTQPVPDSFSRYQTWRPYVEPGFWIAFYCVQAVANRWITWIDFQRLGLAYKYVQIWQPTVWVGCNSLVLLSLVPVVVAFDRRFPLHWTLLRQNLPYHLLASVMYCVAHVVFRASLIKLAYWSQGAQYAYGNFFDELFSQYLLDVRFYFLVIIIVNFYRLLLLRWQGEASLLGVPDDGPPVEPVEHPERFLVRKLGKEFLLPATDIERIEAWGNYVNLRVRGHDYPLRSTMAAIETRLDPKRFVRVHRSYIANLDHILQLEPLESGDARANMTDGSQVPVSRRYLDALRKASTC